MRHIFLRNYIPWHITPSYWNDTELCNHRQGSFKQAECLARTFIECLKEHAKMKLRYLDLTGYPFVLSGSCSKFVRFYDAITHDMPQEQ